MGSVCCAGAGWARCPSPAAPPVIRASPSWLPPESCSSCFWNPEWGRSGFFTWSTSPFFFFYWFFDPVFDFPLKYHSYYFSHPGIPFPAFITDSRGSLQALSPDSGTKTSAWGVAPRCWPLLTVTLLLLPKCNMNPRAALLNYNLGQRCLVGWKVTLKPHLF